MNEPREDSKATEVASLLEVPWDNLPSSIRELIKGYVSDGVHAKFIASTIKEIMADKRVNEKNISAIEMENKIKNDLIYVNDEEKKFLSDLMKNENPSTERLLSTINIMIAKKTITNSARERALKDDVGLNEISEAIQANVDNPENVNSMVEKLYLEIAPVQNIVSAPGGPS